MDLKYMKLDILFLFLLAHFAEKNNAELCCGKLNQGGPRAVAEQYYFGNIVGNRNISDFIKRGINPYQEWINKKKDMFVREDRR